MAERREPITMKKAYCYHCGSPAELLCDYLIGFESAGTERISSGPTKGLTFNVMDADSELFTCDRPLCRRCAVNDGAIFFCGEAGSIETRDYCLGHAEARTKGWEHCDIQAKFMTKQAAAEARARLMEGAAKPFNGPPILDHPSRRR